MLDAIDIKGIISTIIQPNIKYLLIILVIVSLIARYLDTNIIYMISILLFLIVNYKSILGSLNDIKKSESRIERVIENNRKTRREIHFSEELDKYLYKLRRFKKYNPNGYNEGYKYMRMFTHTIHDLEKSDISHPRQYFENAQLYLKKSLNLFQSIGLSVPEENYIQSLKYNNLKDNNLSNRIGKLCKKIYKYCSGVLYNLSMRFDKDFIDNPNIYKNHIAINNDFIEESNIYDSYELY